MAIGSICSCFGRSIRQSTAREHSIESSSKQYEYSNEKMICYHDEPTKCSKSEVISQTISMLYDAKKRGNSLEYALESVVKETGWWDEAIAKAVLATLEKTLEVGKAMGPALQRVFDEAVGEAKKMEEFAGEHPVLTGVFCTVIAIGVLWVMWPALVEALGFGELGPAEGSFAAAWHSTYGGRVPYGSLFSYLQRLGMTFK